MYQRILVPLDGSKQAESALRLASRLARIGNAGITLLRVVEYPFEMYSTCDSDPLANPGQPDEKLQVEKETFFREAKGYLTRLASTGEMAVSNVSIEVQECPVVEAILSTIRKSNIDLVVMSTIGRDHNAWMMGAITNRIVREAPVPVILIRNASGVPLADPARQHEASKQDEAWIHPGALPY